MSWRIIVDEDVRDWLHGIRRTDKETLHLVSAAIDVPALRGPALGRPLVDTIRGSNLPNLKELRPGSSGSSEVRILFAFDPERQAVLLVGGDKSGDWNAWYEKVIPIAEERYYKHLQSSEGHSEKKGRRSR
ncbi:type II toxin-antitoxin system RelE/ParE family toxin [Actinoallomurus purpureus]|uniref:type II toxin-antitoxin system RelE/ParE family toxin n=1 Tax=Actinoallomurus purpureus TaxID=478114 RepID=UPI002092A142|nr:type II toxin-antitoxin system RelE/ParE family toxin [Actinoallomurus purpureus]MCO6010872.1 type II toxin-antitoxin system RelE/ParE family toxin [Actinoallomurus purpureus]